MFKAPFSFDGRIRRIEYILSYVVYAIAAFVLIIIDEITQSFAGPYLLLICFIPLLWFIIAQRTKRCHDLGTSGWFQIIPFYSLWMLFADSDHGPNEYGPNPKSEGNYNSINEIGQKEY